MKMTKKEKKMEKQLQLMRKNKLRLIEKLGSVCCPITKEILNIDDTFALQMNNNDYIVSSKGLDILREKHGEVFINARIIKWVI